MTRMGCAVTVMAAAVLAAGCAKATQGAAKMDQLQQRVGVLEERIAVLDGGRGAAWSSTSGTGSGIKGGEPSARTRESSSAGTVAAPSVREIQTALKNAGYYTAEIDGKKGPKTRAAIRAFQQDNGLGVDGIVGKKTWAKLQVFVQGHVASDLTQSE